MCACREVDLRVGVCVTYVRTPYIIISVCSSAAKQPTPPLSLLFSLCLSSSRSILHRPFVEGVTMNSLLVTVLLLASAANESGGQGAVGEGVGCRRERGGGCTRWYVYVFPHRCTSAHHKLHMYTA